MLGDSEDYAKPKKRCQVRRKEVWARHWQCDSEAQGAEDKPWRNEESRSSEKGRPRLKDENLSQ